MVSISYGHGHLNDGDSLTDWAEVQDGNTGTTTVDHGDYLNLNVTVAGVGNDAYYWDNDNNLGLSTTTYTKIRWRYKTDGGSIRAKIVLEFNDASTQEVLADSNSSTFTVGSATITAAKTLDHIRLHADHATGDVWYDYVLVYKDDFTLPNCALGIDVTYPNRYHRLAVPGRLTNVAQQLGSDDLEVQIGCDLTLGTWTRTGDDVDGQVFMDIAHNSSSEAFQWLDTEREQLKVTLDSPRFHRAAFGNSLEDTVRLSFHEYRLSSGDNTLETYVTRWGLDL